MNNALTLAIEPIQLVTDAPAPAQSGAPDIMTLALIAGAAVVACILLFLAIRFIAPRITLNRDPSERAFAALARNLKLKKGHRATLRHLAKLTQTPPIALTLCHSAFSTALAEAGADAPAIPATDRAHFLELEHRIFG